MEKIAPDQTVDLDFKCCFFGAIRGKNKNGEPIGIVSHVYAHRNNFSHKDFECSFYASVLKESGGTKDISFDDPEVWKLGQTTETFNRREDIIKQYENESRSIEYCSVEEFNC